MANAATPAAPIGSQWRRPEMSSRDHKIVKIMPEASWKVPGPAQYSLDNGFTLTNFRPGGVHSVPDYVAWGMERRGWAKVLTDDEIRSEEHTSELQSLRHL